MSVYRQLCWWFLEFVEFESSQIYVLINGPKVLLP